MFDNIGNKIKGLAELICWIGIIASVIIGCILLYMGKDASTSSRTEDMAPMFYIFGIVVAGFGSLISWAGSFFMYGFGELVQNSIEIKKQLVYGEGAEAVSKLKDIAPLSKPAAPAPVNNEAAYNEKLQKINNMRRAGQLTDEEYNRAISNLKR